MDTKPILKSQYHAALNTLRQCIEKCPDAMWNDPADGATAVWRVAYHTLFFTQFYSLQDRSLLKPWSRHRQGAESFDPKRPMDPYTRDETMEYWRACNDMIDANVDALDLSTQQCGFPWYKMGTLEHQIVNIRHIQHHAAALSSRLRRAAKIDVDWVGKG